MTELSRRNFLKRTGEAAVALSSLPTAAVLFTACADNPSRQEITLTPTPEKPKKISVLTLTGNLNLQNVGSLVELYEDTSDNKRIIAGLGFKIDSSTNPQISSTLYLDQSGPVKEKKSVCFGQVKEVYSDTGGNHETSIVFFADPKIYSQINQDILSDSSNQTVLENITFKIARVEHASPQPTLLDVSPDKQIALEVVGYTPINQ